VHFVCHRLTYTTFEQLEKAAGKAVKIGEMGGSCGNVACMSYTIQIPATPYANFPATSRRGRKLSETNRSCNAATCMPHIHTVCTTH